jgi:integrase
MRTLRAIYNHARKAHKSLPADNPVNAVDWNGEKRRDTGMGASDLKGWFAELAALDNPIRREFHLFTLLSGCRPTALQEIQRGHVNFGRRMVHIPKPKGGAKRAFDIPLSREMVLCLIRAMRFGRQMYPSQAAEWVFPSDSASGHLAEQKEDRATSELPYHRDRRRRVGVRRKTADEPRYSRRQRRLRHPAQASRGSSPQPTASD